MNIRSGEESTHKYLFEWTLNTNFVIFLQVLIKAITGIKNRNRTYAVRRSSTTSLLQYKQYGFVKNAFTQAAPRVFYLCPFTPKRFLHLASSHPGAPRSTQPREGCDHAGEGARTLVVQVEWGSRPPRRGYPAAPRGADGDVAAPYQGPPRDLVG